MTFGEMLRDYREHAGKTMGDLARYLGFTVPYISDIERNKRNPPRPDRIEAIARFLGVDDPTPLLKAAAAVRGRYEVEAKNLSPRGMETMPALMRALPDFTDEDFEELEEFVKSRKGGRHG